MKLAAFLESEFKDIININYTADMERNLDLISAGKLDYKEFLTEFYKKLEEQASKFDSAKKVCPHCGKPMKLRKGPYGQFWGCTGYPDCKYAERKD